MKPILTMSQILIVDDVITAGTAIREILELLHNYPAAQPHAVLVALDRQERGQGKHSAMQELEQSAGLAVHSLITMSDLIDYIEQSSDLKQHLPAMLKYREEYGV